MRKRRSVSPLSDSNGLASCLMTFSARRGQGEPRGWIYGEAGYDWIKPCRAEEMEFFNLDVVKTAILCVNRRGWGGNKHITIGHT